VTAFREGNLRGSEAIPGLIGRPAPFPFTEGLIPEATRRLFATQRARTQRGFRIARMREGHKPQSIVLVLLRSSSLLGRVGGCRFAGRMRKPRRRSIDGLALLRLAVRREVAHHE